MYEEFRKSYIVPPFVFKNYVDLTTKEAIEVLQCRNDIEVRKWMTSTEEIPVENHLRFIVGLKNSNNNFYWAVYQNNEFLGGISLTGMDSFRANSGIFLNPKLIGKGFGVKISLSSLDFYFQHLKMKSVYSVIQKDNQNAIKLNQFIGCTFHQIKNNFIPIELTQNQWLENRNKLLRLAFGKNSGKMMVEPLL